MRRSEAALVDDLKGKGKTEEFEAIRELESRLGGEGMARLFLQSYRNSRKAGQRAAFIYHLFFIASTSESAFRLAIDALSDRAYAPRSRACQLLAFSLRADALPSLRAALEKCVDDRDRQNFLAAIDAIEHQNQHLFVDRDHSGRVFMNIQRLN